VAKKTISSIDREDGQNLKGNQRDTSYETDKYGRRIETKQTKPPDEVDKYGRKVKKEEPPTDRYKRDEPKKEEPQRD